MNKLAIPRIEQYTFDIREDTTIHLGIHTNILCVDDRKEPLFLGIDKETFIIDYTATLYLDKITFTQNKQDNLSPIYTLSNISESHFERLNIFWLNKKINLNPKKSFKSILKKTIGTILTRLYYIDESVIAHQKIYHYRSKDNII